MPTKPTTIPFLTLAIGLLLTLALIVSGVTAPRGEQALPLLTLLFISELGFLITLGGALYAIKQWRLQRTLRSLLFNAVGGFILATVLLLLGLNLWFTTIAA